jgi:ubiquitin fusion degradation protein 1
LLPCSLEYNFFTKYTCLTAGETITVTEADRRYRLDVVEAQPEDAVLVLETDCKVDFATPLDYVEPPPPKKPVVAPPAAQAAENNNNEPPVRFTGVAKRLDGKPVLEQPTTPAPAAAGKAKYGVRFGGVASGDVGKKGTEEGGDKDRERKEQRFTGKAHSLR